MLQVAGTKKVVGAAIGISSFIVLFFAGLVNWPYAITMMVASGSGAWIGVSLGIKAGDKWIKKLFILIILASAVKLIFF